MTSNSLSALTFYVLGALLTLIWDYLTWNYIVGTLQSRDFYTGSTQLGSLFSGQDLANSFGAALFFKHLRLLNAFGWIFMNKNQTSKLLNTEEKWMASHFSCSRSIGELD